MIKTIEGTADCEIRPAIRFLNARNVLLSEIHHQICQACGDNAMVNWASIFGEWWFGA